MDVVHEGPWTLAPDEHFTGTTWIESVSLSALAPNMWLFRQHSEAGARSGWHMHEKGQLLVVVEGEGRVQSRGADVVVLRAGDIVTIEPGEWHWHGGGTETAMVHVAVQWDGREDITWGPRT